MILDACVLYPAPLRDLLIELAASGLFRARWTAQIHDEWMRNLLANRPDLTLDQLLRTRTLMDLAVPDCLVDGYEGLVEALDLPDVDDRHVLAAAIKSASAAIVTFNLRDFPRPATDRYDVEAIHPDDFLHHQFGLNAAAVLVAVQSCRSRLKRPPRTAAEYLATLEQQGLTKTVATLRDYAAVI